MAVAGSICLAAAGACAPSAAILRQRLESHDAAVRIRALGAVVRRGEPELVPAVVDRLDDHDPAVRMYAILTLEKLTGTRLGYRYYAPSDKRRAAVAAWRRFLADQAATTGAQEPGTEAAD